MPRLREFSAVLAFLFLRFALLPLVFDDYARFLLRLLVDVLLLLLLYALAKKSAPLRSCFFVWRSLDRKDIRYALLYVIPLILAGFLFGYFFPPQREILFPQLGPLVYLFLFCSSALEELFFRNYLVKRGQRSGLSRGMSSLISSLIFAVGHVYQGYAVMAFSFFIGLFFCSRMIRHNSIIVCIISHSIYNMVIYTISLATA